MVLVATTKVCTKCGEDKSFSEFGKLTRGRYGLQYYCKECRNSRQREYYYDNTELIIERAREYRKEYHKRDEVKKKANELMKEYHKTNNIKYNEYQGLYVKK